MDFLLDFLLAIARELLFLFCLACVHFAFSFFDFFFVLAMERETFFVLEFDFASFFEFFFESFLKFFLLFANFAFVDFCFLDLLIEILLLDNFAAFFFASLFFCDFDFFLSF